MQNYVQPRLFTPPAPLIDQRLSSPRSNALRYEFGPTNPTIPVAGIERYDFILPNAPLTEEERKYCRCLLRVEERGGARNAYAVCTSRVGAQVHSCSQYYDWTAMSFDVLVAYAKLHNLEIAGLNTRDQILQTIGRWKQSHGEFF